MTFTQPERVAVDSACTMLSFQKLDVYQRALQFLVVALEVISRLPKGHAELAAQLRNAAQSTVANIAEGARDSGGCGPSLLHGAGLGDGVRGSPRRDDGDGRGRRGAVSAGGELLERVVAMLTKMCDL